ncbi:MAG: DsbA family protein [Acidimicrobiales bacterium]
MTTREFTVNFDYRCPFARNAHEHVLTALEAGADYRVRFLPFSLSQAHVEEGGTPVWDDPAERPNLLAVAAGIAVRDRMPAEFPAAHRSLFAARHDESGDLREESVVGKALERVGVDVDAVFADLAAGWPYERFRAEHEESVNRYSVFGVPTFVLDDKAVFVRLMTRPDGNAQLATETIDRVLGLIGDHAELNELKYTTIPR